ncbi:hypothetical protein LTS10_012882 [Elasticomyces elasticus]|nr:hypothetical protein LTS10_012882 [Elasticomyces elasticus]
MWCERKIISPQLKYLGAGYHAERVASKMRLALAAAFFSCVTSSLTAPTAAGIEHRDLDCKVVLDVIDYFTRYTAQASPFCSAYLQTSTTIVVATVAKTATRTRTVQGTATLYSTATALVKRDPTVARPTWLPDAIGMKLVSSPCSCYVTPPSPSTIRNCDIWQDNEDRDPYRRNYH